MHWNDSPNIYIYTKKWQNKHDVEVKSGKKITSVSMIEVEVKGLNLSNAYLDTFIYI